MCELFHYMNGEKFIRKLASWRLFQIKIFYNKKAMARAMTSEIRNGTDFYFFLNDKKNLIILWS